MSTLRPEHPATLDVPLAAVAAEDPAPTSLRGLGPVAGGDDRTI